MGGAPNALRVQQVSTLSGYLDTFAKIVRDWSDTNGAEARPWCRGQCNAEWGLVPGEYRIPTLNPDEIRSEFQLKALPLLRQIPQTEWEWYFLMQHHGLPTRLLDWTTGSLLGLYFALRENAGRTDAAVWVLDPWALNEAAVGKPDLLLLSDKPAEQYLPKMYGKKPALPKAPIAIVPPYNSTRITVQRGAFTIHGSDRSGLERQFSTRLIKIVISKSSALLIRRALRQGGIGEFTVFPELDALCREIRAVEIEGC